MYKLNEHIKVPILLILIRLVNGANKPLGPINRVFDYESKKIQSEYVKSSHYYLERKNVKTSKYDIPLKYKCPICFCIIKDALLLPCCGYFNCCNECFLAKINNNEIIECLNEKCVDKLFSNNSLQHSTPNIYLRNEIMLFLSKQSLSKKSFDD